MLRRSSTAFGCASQASASGVLRRVFPFMSVQICPGCNGRNASQADICEWCGRPFDGRARGFTLRWWHLAVGLLFGVVVAATAALAFLNGSRIDLRPRPAPSPTPVVDVAPLPTRAATAGQIL